EQALQEHGTASLPTEPDEKLNPGQGLQEVRQHDGKKAHRGKALNRPLHAMSSRRRPRRFHRPAGTAALRAVSDTGGRPARGRSKTMPPAPQSVRGRTEDEEPAFYGRTPQPAAAQVIGPDPLPPHRH